MTFTLRFRRRLPRAAARIALASTLLSCASLMAADSDTPSLTALSQQLGEQAPDCVRFEQRRWMQDLGTELPSSGYFQRQASGLVWQTLSPVKDRVVLSADNPDLPPGLKALLPVLSGLLAGNWDRLEQHFKVDLSGSMAAWQAELEPLDSAVAERLEGVRLSGSSKVDHLKVSFVDGDRLTLELTPLDCTQLDEAPPQ